MSTPTPPIPPALDQAGHTLRQVLLRLDQYARNQVQRLDSSARYAPAVMAHVSDLQALLLAVEQYEQAALASQPPAPVPVGNLSAAQLLAYREADPVYRLGYVRGYQRGVSKGQHQATESVVSLYAQHATLPAPPPPTASPVADHVDLVQRVRLLLAFHQNPAPVSAARLHTLRSQLAPATYTPYPTTR
jgi:hypothetical protein